MARPPIKTRKAVDMTPEDDQMAEVGQTPPVSRHEPRRQPGTKPKSKKLSRRK